MGLLGAPQLNHGLILSLCGKLAPLQGQLQKPAPLAATAVRRASVRGVSTQQNGPRPATLRYKLQLCEFPTAQEMLHKDQLAEELAGASSRWREQQASDLILSLLQEHNDLAGLPECEVVLWVP